MDSPILLVNLIGLSHHLGLSRRYLRREADEGRIPYLKAGRTRLFNVEAVRAVLADRAARPLSTRKARS
ncbi:MAG: hypothetical protein JNK25_06525 [Phycisphaerae bacterium]|nr:hypothetical protein [Phycisphaerae bacterium]